MEKTQPQERFLQWFDEAKQAGETEPTAFSLATATPNGHPSVRVLLWKGFEGDRFLFFTNYASRKSEELLANPRAAAVFLWPRLQKQVRIEGRVQRTSSEVSDRYWVTRPRESQIGAWASRQSSEIESFEYFDARVTEWRHKFGEVPIPRPEFWGGFELTLERVEFWTGRQFRFHEREVFIRNSDAGWQRSILSP